MGEAETKKKTNNGRDKQRTRQTTDETEATRERSNGRDRNSEKERSSKRKELETK